VADLSITKTDGQASYIPGQPLTYTIVVTNEDTADSVAGATVADTISADLIDASWTCVATPGSACGSLSGTGDIATTVDLAALGSATFTLTATASASAAGSISNTATVAAPAGVTDPTPGNNSATDTDARTPVADLSITKTDGQASYIPGQDLSYTIVVTNLGSTDAVTGAAVDDALATQLTGASWTCLASPGSACGSPSGTGGISVTVDLLPAGTATFTLDATVESTATGDISNTATVAAPSGVFDPAPGNNTATDTNTLTTLGFYSVAPCRVLDTRNAAGPLGGPPLTAGATRTFEMAGSCDIPANATAVFGNITVVAPTADGHLRIEPAGNATPNVSRLNYSAGQTRANNGVFGLDPQGRIDIVCVQASGSAGVIVDVAGYFVE
jgi:uncharacterized repeat protein (TIGR01451 family)